MQSCSCSVRQVSDCAVKIGDFNSKFQLVTKMYSGVPSGLRLKWPDPWRGSSAEGWGVGTGYPPAHCDWGSVWRGDTAFPLENFFNIFGWKYCILTHSVWLKYQQKICHVNGGGGSNPPSVLHWTCIVNMILGSFKRSKKRKGPLWETTAVAESHE